MKTKIILIKACVYVAVLIAIVIAIYSKCNCAAQQGIIAETSQTEFSNTTQRHSLEQLLALKSSELKDVDLATMNLICARGLKGSEGIDIEACLKTLDTWAVLIKEDTQSRLPSYYAHPEKYNHSENLFKVVNMVLTLKEQIGVDYNQAIMEKTEFLDSRDFFIHLESPAVRETS